MKKILLLCVFAALVLFASCAMAEEFHEHTWEYHYDELTHWVVCTECGFESDKELHYVSCDSDEMVCAECGFSQEDGAMIYFRAHSFSGDTFLISPYYHYYTCERCGEILENEYNQPLSDVHKAICLQPDECAVCGGKEKDGVIIDEVVHNWVTQHDKTCHWSKCSLCGEETPRITHYASCTSNSPGVCSACGASVSQGDTVDYVRHDYSTHILDSDAYEHWYPCQACGAKIKPEKHYGSCRDKTTCQVCVSTTEYNGAVMDHWEHLHYNGEWEHDGAEHWYICSCGEETIRESHYASCAKPGVCHVCGVSCQEVRHLNSSPAEYSVVNEASHRFRCDDCFALITEPHRFSSGVCVSCGYRQPGAALPTPPPTATPAPTATPSPTDVPPSQEPEYQLGSVAYDGKLLSGALTHIPGTKEIQDISVRVTFYIEGNYYMATTAEVEEDGTFAVDGVGPIVYITALATGTERNMDGSTVHWPFGSAELFVK